MLFYYQKLLFSLPANRARTKYSLLFFQETPNEVGIGGALLICSAIILSAVKKVLDEKLSGTHPIKAKYCKIFFDTPAASHNLESERNPNSAKVQKTF